MSLNVTEVVEGDKEDAQEGEKFVLDSESSLYFSFHINIFRIGKIKQRPPHMPCHIYIIDYTNIIDFLLLGFRNKLQTHHGLRTVRNTSQ